MLNYPVARRSLRSSRLPTNNAQLQLTQLPIRSQIRPEQHNHASGKISAKVIDGDTYGFR